MKKKKMVSRAEVLGQMMTLATHPVNDAVRLAYLSEDSQEEITKLDLTGLTEFKRNANGTVEIKFTDRMTVLEALMNRLEEEQNEGTVAFLHALQESGSQDTQECSRR